MPEMLKAYELYPLTAGSMFLFSSKKQQDVYQCFVVSAITYEEGAFISKSPELKGQHIPLMTIFGTATDTNGASISARLIIDWDQESKAILKLGDTPYDFDRLVPWNP